MSATMVVHLLAHARPPTGTSSSAQASQFGSKVDLDTLYLIMEALENDNRSLKACSLVCYFWFGPARRFLFHTIHLRSSPIRGFTTSPNRPPSESPFPVYENFRRHLDSLSDGHDATFEVLRRRGDRSDFTPLKFDFRPFVQELYLTGESPNMLRRTLAIYPGHTWHKIIYLRLTQVVQIVKNFPKLRVLAFREARSFFSPTHHYNILWPVFWAFASQTEELRLENNSWTAGSLQGGNARIDLDEALGSPIPSETCRIHTLNSDDLISRDVDHFFGRLAGPSASFPRFKSLRLPITVLEKAEFGNAVQQLAPYLKHLRFDLLSWRNYLGLNSSVVDLACCKGLRKFEVGSDLLRSYTLSEVWGHAQELMRALSPEARQDITIILGGLPIEERASHTDWDSSLRRFHDINSEAQSRDESWAGNVHLRTVTFRVSWENESRALLLLNTFPKLRECGKLRIVVE